MTLRSLALTTLFAASLFAAAVQAHDPSLHESIPVAKAKPITCEELADTERYSADLADKALKATCEAEARKAKDSKADTEEERS
ncbi:hypothetical protein [uncultured Aquimonas sp.]|uniref:hypothetical protein n=1 Tax=uncultured Aquimonas sp. TaxID=385483 RepID=UPI0026170561|nr:hypothetical protein [uncultured Aquimonas sp.]